MPEPTAFVDEVATELDSWSGVRIEPRPDSVSEVHRDEPPDSSQDSA